MPSPVLDPGFQQFPVKSGQFLGSIHREQIGPALEFYLSHPETGRRELSGSLVRATLYTLVPLLPWRGDGDSYFHFTNEETEAHRGQGLAQRDGQ